MQFFPFAITQILPSGGEVQFGKLSSILVQMIYLVITRTENVYTLSILDNTNIQKI